MAKITKSTDKSGRTVYKIAGTKKFAFTLAKAKEIAAKGSGTGTRAPVMRKTRVRGSAEEGWIDTKPLRRGKKAAASREAKLVSYVINNVGFGDDRHPQGSGVRAYKKAHAAFKKDPYTAAGAYDISPDHVTPSFVRTVLRELKSEIDDLEGLHKPARTRGKPAKRRTNPRPMRRTKLTARDTKTNAQVVVDLEVPRPTVAKLMNFYRDIKEMGGEALAERGINPATDAFALKVRAALEDAMDKLDGTPRRKTPAHRSASGKPAKRRTTRRKTVSRAKPTKILGRSVTAALKIVRTKGRDLKESDANKKKTVARYRKALQRAGYLR